MDKIRYCRGAELAPSDRLGYYSHASPLILEMTYGSGLGQVTIAAKITEITTVVIKQYQVSRELDKVYRHLAKKFLPWASENLHISFQSHDREVISKAIEPWLTYYYQTSATTQED